MKLLRGDLRKQLLWCKRAQGGLLALLLIVCGGTYALFIVPANAQLDAARERLVATAVELRHNQDQAGTAAEVETEIHQLEQRVERFDQKLPKQQDLARFVDEVTRIGQESSLTKLAWHLDSKAQGVDRVTELPIQFTFEGDFQTGIVRFLQAIERMPRLTRVRKLNLKTIGSGQVQADLMVSIYFEGGN